MAPSASARQAGAAEAAAPRYCQSCVYPDTKPGMMIDFEGVCSGCRAQISKRSIDWGARAEQLRTLADRFRRGDGRYDCLIPVSGGKDSHAQVYYAKEVLDLRPLCVTVMPQSETEAGAANLANLRQRFGVDVVALMPDPAAARALTRHGMQKNAWPNWAQDKLIYSWPLRQAIDLNIPLVFMGENHDFEKGGKDLGQGPNAAAQMLHSLDGELDVAEFAGAGVGADKLNPYFSPSAERFVAAGIEVHWLGYYFDWDSHEIFKLAERYGFRPLDRPYAGMLDAYSGIDDIVVPVNGWLKFIKFGFGPVTETAFNHISYGRMSRAEAVEAVNTHDGILDETCKRGWLDYAGMTEAAFDAAVERFANHDLVHRVDGRWMLRQAVR
jgi:N-acetyl sugar amidotransferase